MRLTNQKKTRVCVRSINQSNRSIYVRLLFLFCSRGFISRSYENRYIRDSLYSFAKPHGPVSYSLTFHVFDTNLLPVPPSVLSSKNNQFSFAISKRREMRQLQVNRLQKFDARRVNIKDATGKSLAFIKRR